MTDSELRRWIRDVPDFPKPGILFRDITPLLLHPPAFRAALERMGEEVRGMKPDLLIGIEARGFMFAGALAFELGLGFAPVRKPGKLPWRTTRQTYDLEYGTDSLEMHADAVVPGSRVVVVDDLLATGGTAAATGELVREQGAKVVAYAFVIELGALQGQARLGDAAVEALLVY